MWTSHRTRTFSWGICTLIAAVTATCGAGAQVVDNTPPVITLLGANPFMQDCTGVYVDPGTTVTDDMDPAPTVQVDSSNVNPDSAGTYTVVYSARDASGNVRTATRTAIVSGTICDLGVCEITGIAFDTSVSGRYLIPDDPGSVELTPGYRPVVLSHPTFFDSDPDLGATLLTEPGAWDGAAIQNTLYHRGVLTFETSCLSAFGVFEEVALPPTLSVTPNPAFTRVLGIVEPGASVNVTYTVKNTGSGVVNGAASIIGGNGAFSLLGATAYTLATNQVQPITLRFAPRAAGDCSASLRFTSGADAISVNVKGAGMADKAFSILGCGARAVSSGVAGADLAVALCAAALILADRMRRRRAGRTPQ